MYRLIQSLLQNDKYSKENIAAIEFFRRNLELYYFKGKNECDFIIKNGIRVKYAVQVCWELTSQNIKREISGLVEACKVLNLPSGIILTYNQEQQDEADGIKMSILPIWKWLLTDNISELLNNGNIH